MHIIHRLILSTLAFGILSAATADPIIDLRFSDGVSRTAADFAGQPVFILKFNRKCSGCTAHLTNDTNAKEAIEWINKERIPAWVILVSPNADQGNLAEFAKSKGISGALTAFDPVNEAGIGVAGKPGVVTELLDAKGEFRRIGRDGPNAKAFLLDLLAREPGVHAIPVTGLTESAVIETWWRANRDLNTGALNELGVAAKRDMGLVGEQAQVVVTAAAAALDAAIAGSDDSFASYLRMEALARRFDGIDMKSLKKLLSTLSKNPTVKNELKARAIYLESKRLVASPKPSDQAAGKDVLAQLFKAMPDTVYGAMAGLIFHPKS